MPTEISDIKGVGPRTVDKLSGVGVETLTELSESSVSDLQEAGISEQKSEKMIQRAKEASLLVQTASERQTEYDSRRVISTGIEPLDETIGGGLEAENIINVFGRSGSGKTQFAFQCLVSAVEETGDPAVYVETERNRMRPNRIHQLSSDEDTIDQIYTIGAYDLDDQFNAYTKIQEEFPSTSIVVIDSFNSRFRLASEGRGSLSDRSREIGEHINQIEEMAVDLGCPVILTAQIYDSPTQYGKSDIPWGGNVYMHLVTYGIRLKPASGELYSARIENHPEYPEEEVHLNITEDRIVGIEK